MTRPADRTKWISIQPTDPPTNIPVTESSPLTSIKVEPKEAATVFKTTEQSPLTDILVAPSAGNLIFHTRKRTPAIADRASLLSFGRVRNQHVKVGAGNYNQDFFSPAAGKVFQIEFVNAMCTAGTPTFVNFMILNGGVEYVFYAAAYGAAWSLELTTTPMILGEDDTLRVQWIAAGNGNTLNAYVFGHYIDAWG